MTDPVDGAIPAVQLAPEPTAVHDALAAREAAHGAAHGADRDADVIPLSSVGVFAARRTELGMSLEDVANQLKFSPRQIEALEAGDFEKLPGGTFARGMMRSYARLLKLEPAQIAAQLSAAGANPQVALEQAVSLRTPIPFSEGGKHVNLVYAVLSIVILAAVVFFVIQWYQENSGVGKLAFVRPLTMLAGGGSPPAVSSNPTIEEPHAGVSEAASGTSRVVNTTLASAGATPVPETTPHAHEQIVDKAVPQPASANTDSSVKAAPAAPASTSTGAPAIVAANTPLAASGKRRISLRFDSESWVQIRGGKGEILLSQLNPAGSEKTIEGAPPFALVIGNAHSVHLTYDNQTVDLRPYFNVDVARLTLN